MEDFFRDYVMNFDISNIHYDIKPFTYYNPRKKGHPEYRTLSQVGFPHDIDDAPSYYNYELTREYGNKMAAHWKRKLPTFTNHYLEYLLVFNDREKATEKFVADCEPYGVSREEAINELKNRYLYYLEPSNTLEVIKEFIFLILEYAPKDFGYFITCYGLDKNYKYKEPYRIAELILSAKVNIFTLTPNVVRREIVKGTSLIDIYKNVFENKSTIKDAVKSFPRDAFSAMPYNYYQRKIERLLLSQSNLDYTIGETRNGVDLDYGIYSDGEFLFGIVYDDELVLYNYIGDDYFKGDFTGFDEFILDDTGDLDFEKAIKAFDEQLETIKTFDNECLKKGVLVYHVTTAALDELDAEISSDIRSIRKDINYLYDIIRNGKQFSALREVLIEEFEDYE